MNHVATTYILAIKPLYPIGDRYTFDGPMGVYYHFARVYGVFAYNFGYPIKYTNPIFRSFFVSQLNRKRTPQILIFKQTKKKDVIFLNEKSCAKFQTPIKYRFSKMRGGSNHSNEKNQQK